jgi:hypothetical protein
MPGKDNDADANENTPTPDLHDEPAGPKDSPRQSIAVQGRSRSSIAKAHQPHLGGKPLTDSGSRRGRHHWRPDVRDRRPDAERLDLLDEQQAEAILVYCENHLTEE